MDDRAAGVPLSPQQFQILLSLTDDDRHGYAILLDIERRSGGAGQVGTGALYTAIARLVALGLIRETDRRDADDARRRYYGLTARGRVALQVEATRLDGLLAQARRKGVRPAPAKDRA